MENNDPSIPMEDLQEAVGLLYPELTRLVGRRIGRLESLESVRDVTQSVCRRMIRDLPSRTEVHSRAQLRAWAYRLAERLCLDKLKKHGAARQDKSRLLPTGGAGFAALMAAENTEPGPLEQFHRKELQHRLHEALDKLPEADALVVRLFYFKKLPIAEIGRRLNIQESTAKVRLHRARARLAKVLPTE